MLANHLISVEPYSFFIQSFPASGSLPMSRVSTSLFSAVYCAGLCQLCLILGKPTDCSPPGSSVHGILQARVLEWIAIIFSKGIFPTQVSHVTGRFFAIWAAREAQEYWSGQPTPSAGDLPNPGIELGPPALQENSLPAESPGKPLLSYNGF